MSDSKFKVEFTLKQHTPIIHFQSDQSGATLRATELKPKLDRFIKNDLKHINKTIYDEYKDIIEDKYLFPVDKGSTAYKIGIKCTKGKIISYKTYVKKEMKNDLNQIGSYFAESSGVENINCSLTIKSMIPRLVKLLEKSLLYVFTYENFGTRQTKGFGSYHDIKVKENEFEELLKQKYPIFYKSKNSSKLPLEKIMNDYQLLKSGKRASNDKEYMENKSKLFKYFCAQDIRWEKRMIKEKMKKNFPNVFDTLKYEHEPVRCKIGDENFNYQYIRALLGYAENNEYLKENQKPSKDKIYIQITSADEEVQRYKSPITFKVFKDFIYILPNPNNDINGKTFNFKLKDENKNLNDTPIQVPDNFNLVDFLDFAVRDNLDYTRINK